MKAPTQTIPTTAQIANQVAASNLLKRGLYGIWEAVDGKLTCRWLRYPD